MLQLVVFPMTVSNRFAQASKHVKVFNPNWFINLTNIKELSNIYANMRNKNVTTIFYIFLLQLSTHNP